MSSYFTPWQTENRKRDWGPLVGEQAPNWETSPVSYLFGLISFRVFFRRFALLTFVTSGAFNRFSSDLMRECILDVKQHASCGNCGVVLS